MGYVKVAFVKAPISSSGETAYKLIQKKAYLEADADWKTESCMSFLLVSFLRGNSYRTAIEPKWYIHKGSATINKAKTMRRSKRRDSLSTTYCRV